MLRAALALLLAGSLATLGPVPAEASPAVEKAQRRLNHLGCESGPADGRAGEHTRAAILRFQSRHRLAQSGRLNRATTRRLYDDKAHRCDQRPVPPRRIPRRISDGHQIHADWLVGTNLRTSHGCIRVPKAFSAKVWRFGTIGTRVRVVRG